MGRVICFFVILFISCGSDQKSDDYTVFHYNQPNLITSLDPAFAKSQNNIWAVDHIFNGLVQLDDSLQLTPCIAKSWEVSGDALDYTFHLRNDVKFHPHESFQNEEDRICTAEDVQYSFSRLIDPSINAAGSWVFQDRIREFEPFEVVDDTTFVLHLKQPFMSMLNMLSMQYCSIIPAEMANYDGQYISRNPVGTGGFKFKRWLETQGMYLVKNEEYFESLNGEKLPFIDGVRISFIADKKIAFLELLNGKVDAVSGLESSFINEMLDREGNLLEKQKNKVTLYKNPYLNFEYMGINTSALPDDHALQNKKVRQALNYAIDRQEMLATVRNNIGKAADSGVIPKGLPSYNPQKVQGYEYDINKAAKLLQEAGYPNGEGVKTLEIFTNKDYLDLITIVSKQWEKIGIQTEIKLLETATLRERMRNSAIGMFRASWIADYPDGESFLCMFYSDYPAPPNYTRFENEEVDQLYRNAIQERNREVRESFYHKMNEIVIEEAPLIFLFYDEVALFVDNHWKGISSNALNLLKVKELRYVE